MKLLSLAMLVVISASPGYASEADATTSRTANNHEQLVDEAWQIVAEQYVDGDFNGVDWQQVRTDVLSQNYATSEEAYAAIRSMLGQLDNSATRFLTPEQFAGFRAEDSGQTHIGVGLPEVLSLDVNEATRKLIIVTPLPDTPASEAGIQPGDRVLAIDGVTTEDMDLGAAAAMLRGKEGSTVKLTLQRADRTFDTALKREEIAPIPAVEALQKTVAGRQIGYIILKQFTESSPEQMREALMSLRDADSLVLDLRNNPGGSPLAAVEIAGFFLGDVEVGSAIARTDLPPLRPSSSQITQQPLAVLVNEGTASAAELLAGALQDYKRATIIGAPTPGKGLIHSIQPLADGSAIVVTLGYLYTPSGREILRAGIKPDVLLKSASPLLDPASKPASDADPQYTEALRQLQLI